MGYYRRRLPHWQPEGKWLFITWTLHGSVPAGSEVKGATPGERFQSLYIMLDRASEGPMWLRDPRAATAVCDVNRRAESEEHLCEIGAYVVMGNHVHLLARPIEPAATVTNWIKGVSAREANRLLNRTGTHFWNREFFDRWVRNDVEHVRIAYYIINNPVRAGFVTRPDDWLWSSAAR